MKNRFLHLLPSRNYRSVYRKVFWRGICSHARGGTTLISAVLWTFIIEDSLRSLLYSATATWQLLHKEEEFANEDDKKDIDSVLQKLQRYCIGETNEIYERYQFNKRDKEPKESLDAYITALRTLAKSCNFGVLENSLIRDRIVIGVRDNQAPRSFYKSPNLHWRNALISVDHMRPQAKNWKKLIRRRSIHISY